MSALRSIFAALKRVGHSPGTLLLLGALICLLSTTPAGAAVVFRGSATGINTGLPTNGTAGALTITRPVAAKPGMVMIVSIAARPSAMTWTAPAGGTWTQLSVSSEQPNGGVSTSPGGMTLRTYYRIVGLNEPTSYTWTFANSYRQGGTAVAGMMVFSGIDTGSNPLAGTPTSVLTASGTTFQTAPVITNAANAMMISVLSVLSADSFNTPVFVNSTNCTNSGASAITDVLDVRSPTAANATGTTVEMSYFTQANIGTSCATRATITNSGSSDNGVAHLMALRPSQRDLTLDKTRSAPLSPGGTATYTLTANNEGTLSEPGPLAIVDTLPAGLTYTGYSGNGWSCTYIGQVVTCTRTGALAAGQSAPPVQINVSVAAGLSGVITNSAIVSGTGGDGNSDNDTATETYVILPQPYAYYPMDEAGNATSFANTGAVTSTPATALGSTRASGNPPATVGAALTGTPGTCGAANNPAAAGSEISTGIDVNAIGANAGSIAFWYASSSPWADGNARTLLDASLDGGSAANDRHFMLAKDDSGRLVFSLKDSAGVVSTATSVAYGFGANTWHHIVVTWNLPGDNLSIYLDGDQVPIATSATNVNGALGALDTLYLGGQRTTLVTGAPTAYTANSANGYLDEVRIYNRALVPLEVEGVADLIHACGATVDHYELVVPSSASACTPLPAIQVYACAGPAAATACSGNLQAVVNGRSVGLSTTGGTLGNSAPAFDAIGQANTTLDYPAGGNATITLAIGSGALPAPTALNPARCCPNGSSCTNASSCSTVISVCSVAAANFAVVDSYYADKSYDSAADHKIYTKLAGWNETTGAADASGSRFKLDVVALKTAGSTETGYVGGPVAKTVRMELIDDSIGTACNSTAATCSACAKPVVATVNPVTFIKTDAGYQNDVTVALSNTDAYQRLIARITDTSVTPTVTACSADAFALRPGAVQLTTNATAAGSPLATATPAIKAGTAFTLFARTAYGSNYTGTLTLDTSMLSAQDASQTTVQGGGTVGTLAPATLTANPSPAPTGNALYTEVGYLYLSAGAWRDQTYTAVDQNGDCHASSFSTVKSNGRYGCWIGTEANFSLGRFIPDHFVTTLVPGSGSFSYSAQPFKTVTVSAVNASGALSANYKGIFAASVDLADANSGANQSAALGKLSVGGVVGAPVPASKFVNGVATLDGTVSADAVMYTFNARQTLPLETRAGSAPLQLRATTGADSLSSIGFESAAVTPIYSGRVQVANVYGSALLPLSVPVTTQYYTSQGWVTNTADGGASGTHLLAPPAMAMSGGISSAANCPLTGCGAGSDFTGGVLDLRMVPPGTGGYVDLVLNVPSWLEYPWTTAAANDPRARVTFGVYKGKNRVIYRRERY
ncbi:DUF6701 domain-containing protein [Massilia sp. CF038]|uniref:DUF6701 domain-containing protein n=1 Tax=Massilia sp. CF038 TaxID=1881045 RepID=UPI0009122014|nr:DUF6701 domain-containing protein [Massilia sp. CF038]SHG64495.1 Concanavalin A-like lectin/glucanases superfamily protein [Massilia sp. CF038]